MGARMVAVARAAVKRFCLIDIVTFAP